MARLRREIDRAGTDPYLLTVTGDDRPHCSCPEVTWAGSNLITPAPRGWAESEGRGRQQVTLLWPPAERLGYSLIVDGIARTMEVEGRTVLAVAPTRAVLHRRGDPPAPISSSSSCRSDCVPIFPA
jgi:hypothetical protein